MATYNAADVLPGCLDSIKAQTYPRLEVIVADGASSDGTLDILREYESKLALRWKSEPDEGVYDAWNKALPMASGDWLLFLGADDSLHHPESVARAAERLMDAPADTLLAYGQVRRIHHVGGRTQMTPKTGMAGLGRRIYPVGEVLNMSVRQGRAGLGQRVHHVNDKIQLRIQMHNQGTFHSSVLFERLGKFDKSLKYIADQKMVLQSAFHAAPFYIGDIVIADHHGGGQSSLRRNRWDIYKERVRVRRETGLAGVDWPEFIRAVLWHVLTRLPGLKNQ